MIRRKNDNCPPCVVSKARQLIQKFRQGQRVDVRRLRANNYLSINIGPWWRLLSKNGGLQWALLIHAEYNKEIKK
ncbi:hypothetical protein FRN05_05655 [Salmonella enterica subsp. enterica]|nr:hypothetical protein [Salmonella enterica subsp. enterica serovar Oranienburg]EAU0218253.1 hypothetical protein [Salmonella enterica]EBR0084925.1 hypothetical protein [Salmonella enterica subsp. enterica serovar Wangata]ECK7389129.1 hypothetical protein [Salmonella enterica subsp. enterica serovar Meleagridis]EDP8616256.1 hypothetical protein [Salmonella enterica subsp. enterica]EDT5171030.1 hypothetical protein [Salmonella enterica subsp. enterica serovar Tudu]EEA8731933.1 hypothetical pr